MVFVGLLGRNLPRQYKITGLCLALTLAGVLVACGGGGGSGSQTVTVTPSSAQVELGATQQFTASASGVTWSASGGTINSSGLYTAPSTGTTPVNYTVTATPTSGTAGTAAITIPAVSVSVLPGLVDSLYPNLPGAPAQTQQFTADVTNATNTGVTWAVTGGNANGTISSTGLYTAPVALPNPSDVTVTATSAADISKSGPATVNLLSPTPAGTSTVTVTVTAGSIQHTTTFSLTVL
jgi:hypothetical protein